jgi:DNA invertase Pin-like site-specific DNA recombinase
MQMKKKIKVAIYVRVSCQDQTVDNQIKDLTQLIDAAGWDLVKTYKDEGISGALGREGRPALDEMLKDAARRKYKKLIVWSIDRLGRSLVDLLSIVKTLEESGADLMFFRDGVDTSTASGKLFYSIVGAMAEFERSRSSERIKSGLARRKAQGLPVGRQKGFFTADVKQIKKLREQSMTIRGIASQLGCSTATVQKHIK